MQIDLTIHSFSLWHHFAHVPGFDAIAFADLAKGHGLQGISLSLNDANYRHLGGRETARMDRLRDHLGAHGLSLEIDTSGTDPAHMRTMLGVAARMGADTLRTYTRHSGTPEEMLAATRDDLACVVGDAEALGVTIVLENHEDFTGPELARIVEGVDHPRLRVLYDYGNSQMVLEDPDAALDAVLPHVHSVHVKDHVMIRPEEAGQLTVAGVPMGDGNLPIARLTQRLLAQGLRRLTFENVWAYSAPIRPGRTPLPGVVLGQGSFAYAAPPFDPGHIVLDRGRLSPADLVRLEARALERGLDWYKGVLFELGCTGRWA
jgi:sugar phosphate isomerase/epimerase